MKYNISKEQQEWNDKFIGIDMKWWKKPLIGKVYYNVWSPSFGHYVVDKRRIENVRFGRLGLRVQFNITDGYLYKAFFTMFGVRVKIFFLHINYLKEKKKILNRDFT